MFLVINRNCNILDRMMVVVEEAIAAVEVAEEAIAVVEVAEEAIVAVEEEAEVVKREAITDHS